MASSGTPLPGPRRWPLTLVLGGLAAFGPFSIDTIFPAFPQMAADLGVGPLQIQQTISVYLLAYAAMSLVHGPLSDAFGRKRVLVGGLLVYMLASAGCALSHDLTMLLSFRALQGMSAGAGLIVGRAMIRDLFHGQEAQKLMSQVAMIFSIAPAVAPIYGGWVLGVGGWPVIFWSLVAFVCVLLGGVGLALPETHPPERRMRLSPALLWRDYVSIFANPRFLRLAGVVAFNFGGLFLYIASAPALVFGLLGLDERQFGWLFVPFIAGMMLGSFVSARLAGRVDGGRLVSAGFAIGALAMAFNLAYTHLSPALELPWVVLPLFLHALGLALMVPVVTLAILDMYPRQRGSASSSQAFTQLLANAAIGGALSPLLSRSGALLAAGAAVLVLLAWLCWLFECRSRRAMLAAAS